MERRHLVALAIAMTTAASCVPVATPSMPTTTTTTTTTAAPTTTTLAATTTTTSPPEIAITASDPASPATSTTPRLSGFAPAGSTTVRIFGAGSCTGPAVAGGDPATFSGAGVAVSVGLGSTTTFSALASGPGFTTACSERFTYVNTLTAPTAYEHEPNGTVADANPLAVDVGSPADVQGLLDGPVGGVESDNFTFTVAAGRSIRVETFDWTGAACSGTDTRIYLYAPVGSTGGIDDDSGVGACSLIDPVVDTYAAGVAGGEYRVLVTGTPLGGTYRLRVEVLP